MDEAVEGRQTVTFEGYEVSASPEPVGRLLLLDVLLGVGAGSLPSAVVLYGIYVGEVRLDPFVTPATVWGIETILGVQPGPIVRLLAVGGVAALLAWIGATLLLPADEDRPVRPVPAGHLPIAATILGLASVGVLWTMLPAPGLALGLFLGAGMVVGSLGLVARPTTVRIVARLDRLGLGESRRIGVATVGVLFLAQVVPDPTLYWLLGYILARICRSWYVHVVVPIRARRRLDAVTDPAATAT